MGQPGSTPVPAARRLGARPGWTRKGAGPGAALTHTTGLGALLADGAHPLTAALASLHGNCFVADLGLVLVWMNRSAHQTLRSLAPALRSSFRIEVQDLLGTSIHRFHHDPARIDALLNDAAALPRTAQFTFGPVTLATRINAITDASGRKLGYAVLWDDISARAEDYRQFDTAMDDLTGVARAIVTSTGNTAGNAHSVAAAAEQLQASVAEIARSSGSAGVQVADAVAASQAGMQTLRQLQRTSNEIGDFLRLITSVSEQTKLLALNATIEAARAGQAGKGFAVVAEEVKSLAGTTANSISDIESRIAAIQAAAGESVAALQRIDSLVEKISESQSVVGTAIEEQSAVAQDIAQSAAQIAAEVDGTAEQVEKITSAVQAVTARTSALRD
jgi:methyl-accepting chemotaxis protein